MYVVNPVRYKRYILALKIFTVVAVMAVFAVYALAYWNALAEMSPRESSVFPPVPPTFDRLVLWYMSLIGSAVGTYVILRSLLGLAFYPLMQHGRLKEVHEEMLEKVREFSDKGKLDFVRVKMSHAEISVRTVPILGGVMYHVHVVRRHRTLFTWFSYKEMTWYLSRNSLFTSHRRLHVSEIRNVILLLAQAEASIMRGRLLELDITYRP